MNNIVSVKLDSRYASTLGVWQYDYGQVLRITGPELPPAVEVQFSLTEKSGETLSRVGTTVDGVTEVKIPNELLTHSATSNYRIYAYIYLTDETSGNTKYEITIPVRVRSKPTSPAEDPETDPDLFRETIVAVNASAERAENAASSAMESATEAGKYAASASKSAVTAEKTKEDALRKVGEKKREAIEAIQNQATDSKAGLEQTITNADASKKELEHSIETAGTSKTALDKSVELAGTAKTELDTSIREAGTAKIALNESTETAGTVQETLSATVKQAGALDTSLGEKIETGTQLKTDLVTSGEKAVQDIRAAGSEQLGKMQAVAEAFTADREQIATNKEDIGSLKEDLSNKITKFYASNQGETHLADSDNGKIMDMMLYGRSEQQQYSGKNLLKIRDGTRTERGVTVTVNDGVVALKGTATATGWSTFKIDSFTLNGTYILSSNLTDAKIRLANKSYKEVISQNESKTLENKEVSVLCFVVKEGITYDISNILVQIEKGSKVTSYEPYVGGQPSPSPDYPQEIKSVGDSGNIELNVMGANVLEGTKLGVKSTVNGITYTTYENGILITGTATKTFNISLHEDLKHRLTRGVYYLTTSGLNPSTALNFYYIGKFSSDVQNKKVTLTRDVEYSLVLQILEGATLNTTVQVSLMKSKITSYEPYQEEQAVTLPYILNAIPVSSGGNVTINGQQYIADYVDVERGKLVRMCKYKKLLSADIKKLAADGKLIYVETDEIWDAEGNYTSRKFDMLYSAGRARLITVADSGWDGKGKIVIENVKFTHIDEAKNYFDNNDVYACYPIPTPEEIPITLEEVSTFKQLLTYYPVTNISVNSKQLDGYTVFNYPISMANGWNYVKQQLGDTRDYIYDMDAKAQDIDIQSAEAYVNSEYAVALAELEV